MPIKIHGKDYYTVIERVNMLRGMKQDYCITTDVIEKDGPNVIMKATILNMGGVVLATGHAEEVRGSTMINKTSALENCETSAIGRALAAFGLGGTEFASANEVENAIAQQEPKFRWKKGEKDSAYKRTMDYLLAGDEQGLKEVLADYAEPEHKIALWALFNSSERSSIKSILTEDK